MGEIEQLFDEQETDEQQKDPHRLSDGVMTQLDLLAGDRGDQLSNAYADLQDGDVKEASDDFFGGYDNAARGALYATADGDFSGALDALGGDTYDRYSTAFTAADKGEFSKAFDVAAGDKDERFSKFVDESWKNYEVVSEPVEEAALDAAGKTEAALKEALDEEIAGIDLKYWIIGGAVLVSLYVLAPYAEIGANLSAPMAE